MPNLIFADTETTGLNEAGCFIVELALVAVDLPTFKEVAHFSSVVVPPLWPTVKRNLHEKVQEMHEASGLMAELDASLGDDCAKHRPQDVEIRALDFVRQWAPQTMSWHTPLAGANPDFDRRFLKARMPKLERAFHYRNFDVRSITQLQDWIFGVAHVESPHRALADCRQAVAKVREFLGISA